MKKNLRKVFAVSMAGAMVAGCIPAMADEAASTTNWEPFAETVTLRVPNLLLRKSVRFSLSAELNIYRISLPQTK